MAILISNLLLESFFDLRKWSNEKYANTRICVFSIWPLPEVENWFRKPIWNENVHISILIFFLKSFSQYFKKSENGFLIEFSKSDSTWVGFYFWQKKILKKPNTPKYA